MLEVLSQTSSPPATPEMTSAARADILASASPEGGSSLGLQSRQGEGGANPGLRQAPGAGISPLPSDRAGQGCSPPSWAQGKSGQPILSLLAEESFLGPNPREQTPTAMPFTLFGEKQS